MGCTSTLAKIATSCPACVGNGLQCGPKHSAVVAAVMVVPAANERYNFSGTKLFCVSSKLHFGRAFHPFHPSQVRFIEMFVMSFANEVSSGGTSVELSAEDLTEIGDAASKIQVKGDRLPESALAMTGR
jgi:hypothetical protein